MSPERRTSPIDAAERVFTFGKRLAAALLGLIAGLVVGLIALFAVGFGDLGLVLLALCSAGGIACGFRWPAPFLTVAGILLGGGE